MQYELRLDFLRVDVDAAGNNHVGLTVGQIQIAVLIKITDIAGRGPAFGMFDALCFLRIV